MREQDTSWWWWWRWRRRRWWWCVEVGRPVLVVSIVPPPQKNNKKEEEEEGGHAWQAGDCVPEQNPHVIWSPKRCWPLQGREELRVRQLAHWPFRTSLGLTSTTVAAPIARQ